jgi:hypothetical protein
VKGGKQETSVKGGKQETSVKGGKQETSVIEGGKQETSVKDGKQETSVNGGDKQETSVKGGCKQSSTATPRYILEHTTLHNHRCENLNSYTTKQVPHQHKIFLIYKVLFLST